MTVPSIDKQEITDKENSNKLTKNNKMWLEKYKSNGAIINKIKMTKTFNCLGLGILAYILIYSYIYLNMCSCRYSPHIFVTDSQNSKLIKYL